MGSVAGVEETHPGAYRLETAEECFHLCAIQIEGYSAMVCKGHEAFDKSKKSRNPDLEDD